MILLHDAARCTQQINAQDTASTAISISLRNHLESNVLSLLYYNNCSLDRACFAVDRRRFKVKNLASASGWGQHVMSGVRDQYTYMTGSP